MQTLRHFLVTLLLFSGCSLLLPSKEKLYEDDEIRCSDEVDNDGDSLIDCDDAAGCAASCLCGNGIVDDGEQCDDQQRCDDGSSCVAHSDCASGFCLPRSGDGCDERCQAEDILVGCGDGVVGPGEVCDVTDPVTLIGCSDDCQSKCGNNIKEDSEECDDGGFCSDDVDRFCNSNTDCSPNAQCRARSGDGCSATCVVEFCGDGLLGPDELCDDGNNINGDGCDINCSPTACGNHIVANNEECDDGNTTAGDGCDPLCKLELLDSCGDGAFDTGEECDDGNNINGDGCSSLCKTEICGDGVINGGFLVIIAPIGEQCDDGRSCGDGSDCTQSGTCAVGECLARSDDGCNASCILESRSEEEPNDDGSPTPNSSAPSGNDFDQVAVNNALNFGLLQNNLISASFIQVGDEDVFAVHNPRERSVKLSALTMTSISPPGCSGVDTFLVIRKDNGDILAENNDELDTCAGIFNFELAPNETVFVHVIESGDNQFVSLYFLEITTTE